MSGEGDQTHFKIKRRNVKMSVKLFLDFNNLRYYGRIPVAPKNPEGRVEEFHFCDGDIEFFEDDVLTIDTVCGATLDIWDVEFFDCDQCIKLQKWIDERLRQPVAPRYRDILMLLKDYCRRAVELHTGVVIEL